MDTQWQNRYDRAAKLLGAGHFMGALAEQTSRLQENAAPALAWIVNRSALGSAARVGIFAGTFNPVTRAHVALADQVKREGMTDALIWVCAVDSVEKEGLEHASLPDRLAQLHALTGKRHDSLALVNRGLYVEMASLFRSELGPQAQLSMLIGHDKLRQILDPRYYADRNAALSELTAHARLTVVPRGAAGNAEVAWLLAQEAGAAWLSGIQVTPPLGAGLADLSATQARALAMQGDFAALAALLPPEGVALVRETGAFAADVDRYAARLALITRLGKLTPDERLACARQHGALASDAGS